jgi:hypothetical protein
MSAEIFTNARIVTRDAVFIGTVCADNGRIVMAEPGRTSVPGVHDWEGDYLLPGLVELHTDNLEKHLMPRPKVWWPEFPALIAHDAEIAAAGITTVFDALGVGDAEGLLILRWSILDPARDLGRQRRRASPRAGYGPDDRDEESRPGDAQHASASDQGHTDGAGDEAGEGAKRGVAGDAAARGRLAGITCSSAGDRVGGDVRRAHLLRVGARGSYGEGRGNGEWRNGGHLSENPANGVPPSPLYRGLETADRRR